MKKLNFEQMEVVKGGNPDWCWGSAHMEALNDAETAFVLSAPGSYEEQQADSLISSLLEPCW